MTTTAQAAETTTFTLRTDDAAWIIRHHGVTDDTGKTFVQVPAAEVEQFTRMGRPWIRTVFADVPADALNAMISCPVAWTEG
jgi:hypothetical protein